MRNLAIWAGVMMVAVENKGKKRFTCYSHANGVGTIEQVRLEKRCRGEIEGSNDSAYQSQMSGCG